MSKGETQDTGTHTQKTATTRGKLSAIHFPLLHYFTGLADRRCHVKRYNWWIFLALRRMHHRCIVTNLNNFILARKNKPDSSRDQPSRQTKGIWIY